MGKIAKFEYIENEANTLTVYRKINEIIDHLNGEEKPKKTLEDAIFDLVHSGWVRHFNSDNIEDEKETALRLAQAIRQFIKEGGDFKG